METDNKFYVYKHTREDTNSIFYVGKGFGNRAYSKKGRNIYWKRIVNKVGYKVEFIKKDLIEEEAFQLEIKTIKDIDKSNLCNMTDGGEGAAGCIISEKTRKKISIANSGKNCSEETRAKLRISGKRKHSEETKEKLRNYNLGKKLSEETCKRISDSSKLNWENKEYRDKMSKISKKRWESKEYRDKMSKILNGRKHSEETKEKISKSHKGKKLSKETKTKLRNYNLGKKLSEETCKRISIAKIEWCAKNKNKLSESLKRRHLKNRLETNEILYFKIGDYANGYTYRKIVFK